MKRAKIIFCCLFPVLLVLGCQSTGTASSGASDVGRQTVDGWRRKVTITTYGDKPLDPDTIRALPIGEVIRGEKP